MSLWRDALIEERVRISLKRYERLKEYEGTQLTERDRALLEAFAWFGLESDEVPECDCV